MEKGDGHLRLLMFHNIKRAVGAYCYRERIKKPIYAIMQQREEARWISHRPFLIGYSEMGIKTA